MNPTISQWSVVVLPTSALAELIEILDEADILDEVVDALLDAEELRYTIPGTDTPLSKPPWEYMSVLGNPIVEHPEGRGADDWWLLRDGKCTYADANYWHKNAGDNDAKPGGNDGFYNIYHGLYVAFAENLPRGG